MDYNNLITDEDDVIFIEDDVISIEDDEYQPKDDAENAWKVLVVDDDKSVHDITKRVLDGFVLDGKSLRIYNAYNADETKKILNEHPDIALILLDVVMEEYDTGLQLVKYVRDELKNKMVRIILRTGQPGYSPEKEVVINYHINDYKLKTDLTSEKMIVSVVTALRSYKDLVSLDLDRMGLRKIIQSTPNLYKNKSFRYFINGILEQLTSILHLDMDAIYCRSSGLALSVNQNRFIIEAATGDYKEYINKDINEVLADNILELCKAAITLKKTIFTEDGFASYFNSSWGTENVIYIKSNTILKEWDIDLINIACSNISIAFDNMYLSMEMDVSHKEIIYTIGEIAEFRSNETGFHIKRVAEYAYLLALEIGISEPEAECLKIASTMHDVGKLGIPDAILNKPAKLTPEEFEIIKSHSSIGYEMLKRSNVKLMKDAAIIAYQHHEKYNGKGYPQGLKGEDIDLYARIVCIVDVIDALLSKRVYKNSWSVEEVIKYLQDEKGEHFDPVLVEIALKNFDKMLKIQSEFKDE
ncbi:DUF3369 domain-containing protein [Acetivibrio cellulolyticus]